MGASDLEFVLANAQGWMLYLYILGAAALCWWAWRRYGPRPPGLAGWLSRICRVLAILLLVACITDPSWRETITTTKPGRIAVLVDTSASMARDDAPDLSSRLAVLGPLRAALATVTDAHTVSWYRLGGALGRVENDELDTLAADAPVSPLGSQVGEVARDPQYELVLLVSDGRVNDGPALDAVGRSLGRGRGPERGVWTLSVGGTAVTPELHIDEIEGNRDLALGEANPFEVRFSGRSLGDAPVTVRIRRGDEVLAETTLTPESVADPVTVQSFSPELDVTLHDEGRAGLTAEVTAGDLSHRMSIPVEVKPRNLQVVMLAHHPRYEMRYLRNALDRDQTVTVHSYLADGGWRRWGDERYGGTVLPLGTVQLEDYHAVIVGDIDAHTLDETQMNNLATAVRQQGLGLVWLPGERGAIAGFRDSPLSKLIPAELPSTAEIQRGYLANEARTIQRSPAARGLKLFDPGRGTWEELPRLRGLLPVGSLRQPAQVLMETRSGEPVVVARRIGAGRSVLVAVDDTWRWRRNVGDYYLNRFHSPLLRYASAGKGLDTHPWRAAATPYRAQTSQRVQLAVAPQTPGEQRADLPDAVTVQLRGPGETRLKYRLLRVPGEPAFAAEVPAPGQPGSWHLELIDGLPATDVRAGELVVLPSQRERRDPRADHEAMARLSAASGGRAAVWESPEPGTGAEANAAARLIAALPDLSHHEQSRHFIRLWDRFWVFMLVIGLLCVDWALRRANRLP